MPQKDSIELAFPIGGVSRIAGYQRTPPFTAPDALNVWPFDAAEGRARGGSRWGTRKAYFTDLGNAVRMLAPIDYTLAGSLNKHFEDSFDSDGLGGNWSAIGSTTLMPLADQYAAVSNTQTGAAALADVSIAANNYYTAAIYVAPYNHAFHGVYRIYLRMNTATPAPTTSGVIVELGILGDAIVANLLSYSAGVETVVDTYEGLPQSLADGNWLRAKVDETGGTDTIEVFWGATSILSGNIGGTAAGRVGFGATCLDPAGQCIIEQFRFAYVASAAGLAYSPQLRGLIAVASGNGHLEEQDQDIMQFATSAFSGGLTLASDKDLCAIQYGQKLYVADHSEVIATGTGTVNGTSFDSASYADWTADTLLGAGFTTGTADDYVLEILTVAASTATVGSYAISVVAAGNLTLGSSGSSASTSCTFRILRVPKIITPNGTSMSRWVATSGKGNVPNGSKVIAKYRGRLWLAEGIQWFACRQDDPLDWFYGRSYKDAKRAISGTLADAGVPGDIITAMSNSSDDYLVMFCPASTWMIVGDPAYTGQIKNVSETLGCVGSKAWCHGPNSSIYHLSQAGLCVIDGSAPRLLGIGKIPRELLNVNVNLYSVSLAYDLNENRVFIFISDPDSNRSGKHWCYDVRTDSFWPLYFPAASQPTSAIYYTSKSPGDSCLIMGCRDGYLRRFDHYCDTDDGNSFNSYVVYGPIELGSGARDGRIDTLIADVARHSRDVSWELRVGKNAELAFRSTAAVSGTWEDGKNLTNRPRRRGNGFCLKVGRFASQTAGWGMERITAIRAALGQRR
jgi:hypothetical protein